VGRAGYHARLLAHRYGFAEAGEQIDDGDGLALVYACHAGQPG
jgi:hypothetical protein